MTAFLAVITWLLCWSWAIQIGVRKHRVFLGVVTGAFAWLGVIVMALIPARKE